MKINELTTIGTKVSLTVCVQDISEREGKRGPYLSITFVDNTGSISAKCWSPTPAMLKFPELLAEKRANSDFLIVTVKGKVDSYNDTPQLLVDDMLLVDSAEVEPSDFIFTQVDEQRKTDLVFYIQNLSSEISNPVYKEIFVNVVSSPYMRDFLRSPAAITHHHNYLYGLIEHSVEVVKLVLAMYDSNPEYYSKVVDRDALIVSALFHDLGKIKEYGFDLAPYYVEGSMPHQVGSSILIYQAQTTPLTPEKEAALEKISGIIYNHHGFYGDEATYNKCTLVEAHMIFSADLFSARTAPLYYK